jgi:malonate transporter and related proteins
MTASITALVPVFLLIGFGAVVRRFLVGDRDFWAGVDRLTYFIFLPALLFRSLATADLTGLPVWQGLIVGAWAVLITSLILFALRRAFGLGNAAFTSVVQGAIRNNTYVAVAAALAIYGDEGLGGVALGVAAFVPIVNVVSIATLSRFGKNAGVGLGRLVAQIVANPLILAVAFGAAVNGIDRGLPILLDALFEILGRAALPLGLLAVGAGLEIGELRKSLGPTLLAGAFKLVVMPALAAGGLVALRLTGTDAGILLLFAAAPTAISSYVLARQMGGDHRLMASIITVETILAVATVPLWMLAVQALF